MNNRNGRPAAGPRASEAFVVDLTSVCLKSGTVRLPLSMIGRFSEGQHKVTAGGEELMLEFEAPRTLSGLAPFFERTELKANDRVQFVFDGQRLELSALKRERPKSARPAAPLNAGSNITNNATGADTGPSHLRSEPRLTGRGLYPAPAELVDVGAERPPVPAAETEAHDGSSENHATPSAAGEQWRDTSVRAVRRVRLEGGMPPRADTAPPRPVDRASAHDVWARRQQAAWRSLDTMVAGPVVPPEEAAEAFSESTIRVVRRSKGTSTPLDVEAPPLRKPAEPEAPQETSRPVSYSMSWPLPETSRPKPQARPADVPAAIQAAPRRTHDEPALHQPAALASGRAELDPYLDAPIDADREADYTPPTILESDLLSIPATGKWRTESEEAFLKYQEAQVASAPEPVAVPAERRQGILGRLGLGRGGRAGGPSSTGSSDVTGPRISAPATPHRPEPTPAPAADEPAASAEPDDLPEVVSDYEEKVRVEVTAATATEPEKRVIVDESVYDVDFDTEVQPHLLAAEDGVPTLESDMAKLRNYLHQPDMPAIVRCDDLAERLQMSQERVASAMVRLAEDRERYTPLRGDAYMVRRVR